MPTRINRLVYYFILLSGVIYFVNIIIFQFLIDKKIPPDFTKSVAAIVMLTVFYITKNDKPYLINSITLRSAIFVSAIMAIFVVFVLPLLM